MFVSFTTTLKKMMGFRIGIGVRVNKSNAIWFSLAMLFAALFYMMWYTIIGCGWLLYFMIYGIYKIYYLLFVGCKKLCLFFVGKIKNRENRM